MFSKKAIFRGENLWWNPFSIELLVLGLQLVTEASTEGVLYKSVLKNFANSTGKHLCWSLFLIKLTPTQVFSCEICEFFKNTYFQEHLPATALVTVFPVDF